MGQTAAIRKPARRKLPRCSICERSIRVPKGWSGGAAVRRHYWRQHRDIMQGSRSGGAQ